ncbi:MAG TPA: hypothetical protein VIT65_21195 [Microlunatus sp.]
MGHRARLGLGLGAAAIVVGVVILLPTIVVRLHPPDVREPGEWRFTHRVEPVAGMTVTRRILTTDHEFSIVRSDADVAQCTVDLTRGTVEVTRDTVDPRKTIAARSVRIHGWRGRYVDDRSLDPSVTWEYAPGARATVTCTRQAISAATLLVVAEAVRFEDARVRLPFTIRTLPEGYRIYSVDEDTSTGTDIVSLSLQPVDRASIPSVVVRYGGDGTASRCLGDSTPGVSRTGRVCLSTRWSAEEAPGAQAIAQRSLDQVAERIEPATDPTDPTTWFDAIDLPR